MKYQEKILRGKKKISWYRASAARGRALGGVSLGEEGVQVVHGLRRAESAEGGEDDGEKGALLGDAPGEVLVVLLGGARGEDGGGVLGGGLDVGGEQRAGDGDVDGGDGRVGRVEGDDEVNLRGGPAGGAGEAATEVVEGVQVGTGY